MNPVGRRSGSGLETAFGGIEAKATAARPALIRNPTLQSTPASDEQAAGQQGERDAELDRSAEDTEQAYTAGIARPDDAHRGNQGEAQAGKDPTESQPGEDRGQGEDQIAEKDHSAGQPQGADQTEALTDPGGEKQPDHVGTEEQRPGQPADHGQRDIELRSQLGGDRPHVARAPGSGQRDQRHRRGDPEGRLARGTGFH